MRQASIGTTIDLPSSQCSQAVKRNQDRTSQASCQVSTVDQRHQQACVPMASSLKWAEPMTRQTSTRSCHRSLTCQLRPTIRRCKETKRPMLTFLGSLVLTNTLIKRRTKVSEVSLDAATMLTLVVYPMLMVLLLLLIRINWLSYRIAHILPQR